jgi:murein DD-endopeptidase MepM/ murein hydrolase activator NlpD
MIDEQVHMGIDLASLAQSPVPASGSGRVAFVDDIGIFGRTVVVDHGFGLFTTYSHLSAVDVQPGQMVARGENLSRTGSTGMAGGDHLHYGMMVHGVFVNPLEWWDAYWIENNILSKIESVKSGLN